jgi:hypothetical protein
MKKASGIAQERRLFDRSRVVRLPLLPLKKEGMAPDNALLLTLNVLSINSCTTSVSILPEKLLYARVTV